MHNSSHTQNKHVEQVSATRCVRGVCQSVLFLCVQMRDVEAPSYYNPVEASTLVKLLQGLLSYKTAGGQGVSVQDIGVIATYRNQVSKEPIHQLCKACD